MEAADSDRLRRIEQDQEKVLVEMVTQKKVLNDILDQLSILARVCTPR